MHIDKVNGMPIERRELTEVVAGLQHAQFIADVQTEIRKGVLRDKNNEPVFAADSKEFVESIIQSRRGEILIYFDGNELVGFFELTCPDNPKELVEDYDLDKHLPYDDVANMGVAESFVVMPKYRGNALQVQMFRRMEEIATERGITSLIGTVHPDNPYSCNSFDKAGYSTVTEIQSHGGPRLLKLKYVDKKKVNSK